MFERPEVTSYEPPTSEVTCRALIPYEPSPFGPLPKTTEEQAPLNSVTGALIGFNRNNIVETLHLAFPDPFIRAIISHAFRESILVNPSSNDQFRIIRDKQGQIARVFFTPHVADLIWNDLRRLAQIVLSSTSDTDKPCLSVPTSYSKDFLNLEWTPSILTALLPHITFAHANNPLRAIYSNSIQQMHEVYTIIQFVARRYAQWILEQVLRSISLGYLSASNWGSYFGLTHDDTLTRLTQKSVARLEAEKEIVKRRSERRDAQNGIPNQDGITCPGLILHPTESFLGRQSLLTPYTPLEPGWDISAYAPSADVTLKDESCGDIFVQTARELASK
ncbi:hypothetical protein VKT23_015351 [Stygiomarasmius scandens]|uniref:Uncharacterized protein n=1 Tax=Marasmiellus scandens TaxID=2682957 RepID=A0ABR1J0W4_9AGAR